MSFTKRAVAFAKLWLFPFVLAAGLVASNAAQADGFRPDRIVVFGDSLSDPGNLYAILKGFGVEPANVQAPDYGMTGLSALTLIPSLPYAIGGNRFSNGPTWIETVGNALGFASNVEPAWDEAANRRASNYAVGGARASDSSPQANVPLSEQVARFFGDVGRHLPRNGLYVIAIGGNDIRDALDAALDPSKGIEPAAVIGAALQSLGSNIVVLHRNAGAKRILVWNAPDLSRTPGVQRLIGFLCSANPGAFLICVDQLTNQVRNLSIGYNQGLAGLLHQIKAANPGIDFIEFDVFSLLAPIQENPGRYGLTNASAACIEPFVGPLFRCAQPDEYFFWDGIHPTRAGHAVIAALVVKALVAEALRHD